MSVVERDLEEFGGFFDRAPGGLPYAKGDEHGYHMDLLCRAGKEVLANPTLKEVINYLLAKHSMSGMLRPIIMTVARMLDAAVSAQMSKTHTR